MKAKAITICNPYPELILLGEKPIENREWATRYRGELFIHAGKSRDWMTTDAARRFPNLVYGAIVGTVDMIECLEMPSAVMGTGADWPDAFRHLQDHEHANGPWCHIYANPRRLAKPVPCRGALGFWTLPPDVEHQVRAQLREGA